MNFINTSSLRNRLFNKICEEMNLDFDYLFYYTQVRWLSKSKFTFYIFLLS